MTELRVEWIETETQGKAQRTCSVMCSVTRVMCSPSNTDRSVVCVKTL